MRLLFVTSGPTYPLDSGNRIRMYHLMKNLAKNHEIYLVSFVQNEVEFQAMDRMNEFCKLVKCVYRPGYIRTNLIQRIFKFFMGTSYYIDDFKSVDMKKAIRSLASSYKFELAHFDFIEVGQYVDDVKGIPTVLTEHDIFYLKTCRYLKAKQQVIEKLVTFKEWIKLYQYEPKIWDKFDRVIVTSDHDASLIKSRRPKVNVSIVPNGVDTEYFAVKKIAEITTDKLSLVYTGTLNNVANRDAVLFFYNKIFHLIKNKIPEIKWYIVGRAPTYAIQELGEKDSRIIIAGAVEDVRPYIAKASVYVVPIRIGSGTRLKILEAMAMKKAVISTSIGCEGLNVQHNKNILIADNPQQFANLVIRAINNQPLRLKLGENGRKLVESEYDWKICAEKMEQVFVETCASYNKRN
jgi:sugar transferase (PEP-CTERM/EpsH1 system associated)